MLKDKFLIKVTNGDLFAFYINYMVYADSPLYELFPGEVRTEELEEEELKVVVTTGESVETLQKMIMLFAQNVLDMDPVELFFPEGKVVYFNTLTNMTRLAGNWKMQLDIATAITNLPEYTSQYQLLDTINTIVETMSLSEGVGLTLLNDYFRGGGP